MHSQGKALLFVAFIVKTVPVCKTPNWNHSVSDSEICSTCWIWLLKQKHIQNTKNISSAQCGQGPLKEITTHAKQITVSMFRYVQNIKNLWASYSISDNSMVCTFTSSRSSSLNKMITTKLDNQSYSQPLCLGHTVLVIIFRVASENTDATK